MELNLKELRIKLDQLTERIISRLKDRSRCKLNAKVYQKNVLPIKNRKNISFFEFALEGLENYHASLGRYKFPDQYPIFHPRLMTAVKRKIPFSPVVKVKIDFSKEIIKFHLNSLKKFCALGDDSSVYGETVYCDADIIELLNERINLGRFIAQVKLKNGFLLQGIKSKKQLEKRLRNLKREKEIIKKVKEIARKYTFPTKITEEYFRWIIKETIKIEIEYLKKVHPRILLF